MLLHFADGTFDDLFVTQLIVKRIVPRHFFYLVCRGRNEAAVWYSPVFSEPAFLLYFCNAGVLKHFRLTTSKLALKNIANPKEIL